MSITTSGDVGIGTNSPVGYADPTRRTLQIEDTGGSGAELRLNSTAAQFRIFNNNTEVGFGSDTSK